MQKFINKLKQTPTYSRSLWKSFGKIKKILVILISAGVLMLLLVRLFALKYQHTESSKDYQFGTTFVQEYAEHLGLDPKETFTAIVDDLKIKNLRLVSYWSEIEKEQGSYDFSDLDWQFKEAEKRGVKVSLALGLRQPRWPECHQPKWSLDQKQTKEEWYPELKTFISEVVKRYKDSPSLASYQLENEFFLTAFGLCTDFSRDRLVDEFKLVKAIDPKTPIIMNRSNNWSGWAVGEPEGDKYGISIYRRTHNATLGYVTVPYPAWYYAFLAAGQKAIDGKPTVIHEFQLEPWIANGDIKDASIEEQNKTMSRDNVEANINYAKRTGIKEVYLWGSEWWYLRLKNGDPTIWNTVKAGLE